MRGSHCHGKSTGSLRSFSRTVRPPSWSQAGPWYIHSPHRDSGSPAARPASNAPYSPFRARAPADRTFPPGHSRTADKRPSASQSLTAPSPADPCNPRPCRKASPAVRGGRSTRTTPGAGSHRETPARNRRACSARQDRYGGPGRRSGHTGGFPRRGRDDRTSLRIGRTRRLPTRRERRSHRSPRIRRVPSSDAGRGWAPGCSWASGRGSVQPRQPAPPSAPARSRERSGAARRSRKAAAAPPKDPRPAAQFPVSRSYLPRRDRFRRSVRLHHLCVCAVSLFFS